MCRRLTKLLRIEMLISRKSGGFTLTEVVIATSLLIIATVPILRALTGAHVTSSIIERRTRSLTLAQTKLDEIKARSIYNYGQSFTETNNSLEGSFLCNIEDISVNANLRKIKISVGKDLNENSTLNNNEIEITLSTLLANRW
jgi:type II secretory pathway pseudopilin PulG